MHTRRTRLVQRWQPGDRAGSLYFVSAGWRDHALSRFCSHSELNAIVRDFIHQIPREERGSIAVSVAIKVYSENGGHKRVVLDRWRPGGASSLEQFSQHCKALASEYRVVYPPSESVEIHDSEE